ncbi:8601_t:CDS:1, partial [Gigaspora margarita]
RYSNSNLKRDYYAIAFANPNNVNYYVTISLKLSPSVTSQIYSPTSNFKPSNSPDSGTNQQSSSDSSTNPLFVGVAIGAGVLLGI